VRHRRSGIALRRHHSSRGKYFHSDCHRPSRRRWHQGSCSDSAGCHPHHRHRSRHPCSASECRPKADLRQAGPLTRSDRRSDRPGHSARSAHRRWNRRPDYHPGCRHRTARRPESPGSPESPESHPASRRSCCHRCWTACWSHFAHRMSRCCPARTIASHPGSASKNRSDRHRRTRKTACSTRSRHQKSRLTALKMRSRRMKTIAAAAEGNRPSGMHRPRRPPSPVRRQPAETFACAEYASFLLVPRRRCPRLPSQPTVRPGS